MGARTPIALIDDDRVWMETLADYLQACGFEVRTAQGGRRGLDLLRGGGVGLAIVDFHMPDLNGLEVVRELRRGRHDVDVLLMSSDDDPSLPRRAVAEGAAAFLSKSVAPRQLLRSLTDALGAALAEMALRPASGSRWDRFLPVPRGTVIWLPIPVEDDDVRQN